jgi:hypothetical protein
LNELEEIAVDDEFDRTSAAFGTCRLGADELCELVLIVNEVIAGVAVSHMEIAHDERDAPCVHVN